MRIREVIIKPIKGKGSGVGRRVVREDLPKKRVWQGERTTQISQGRALQIDTFQKHLSKGRLDEVKVRGEAGANRAGPPGYCKDFDFSLHATGSHRGFWAEEGMT